MDRLNFHSREQRRLFALTLEWQIVRSSLNSRHICRRIRQPHFELHDTPGLWGRWHGGRKTISISALLLEHYSWPTVIAVLRHEIAHQIAEQAFGETAPPHGPCFLEACKLIRADPKAASILPSIYQRIEQDASENAGKCETIRKLLALAASPHPAEAEAAMLKAHALMVKYNIAPGETNAKEFVSIVIGDPAMRHSAPFYALACILRDFFFVATVFIPMSVPETCKKGNVLEITGAPENVKMAAYVFEFLRRAAAETGKGQKRKIDYEMGFYLGVNEKLAAQRKEIETAQSATCALIRMSRQRIKQALRRRYPRLRSIGSTRGVADPNAFQAGHATGRNISINRPLEQKHSGSQQTGSRLNIQQTN